MTTRDFDGRVTYQLHALRAAGVVDQNPDPSAAEPVDHGLSRLVPWLDHVADLGCGAVQLTPIFVSHTHGYDTVDPFRIDQRLGDDTDFDRLVSACHRRDLRLILDGVFNHVGRGFAPFHDVLAHGRTSAARDWFHLDFDRDDGDGFAYKSFEGHRELVTLNHDADHITEWARRVVRHWTDRGVDGWRIDAAYAMPRRFIADLVTSARESHPGMFVYGEVIHGDYAGFVADTGLDAVTQYELHKAIWSSLNDGNLFELAWALERHRGFVDVFAPVTFVGNHDVTRIASQLHDPAHLAAALALLLTLPGHPCIYYGDELGWSGTKEHRPGGDDAIRPPLPNPDRSWTEPENATRTLVSELVALRRREPWLTTGRVEINDLTNRRIAFTTRANALELCTAIDLDTPTPECPTSHAPRFSAAHILVTETTT